MESMEFLLEKISETKTNKDFLGSMGREVPSLS
jgi:transcription termination factor Rho